LREQILVREGFLSLEKRSFLEYITHNVRFIQFCIVLAKGWHMTSKVDDGKPRRRAPQGYEIIVPLAIGLLTLLLLGVIVLVAAFAAGLLPSG
jgi:hypothetical protein